MKPRMFATLFTIPILSLASTISSGTIVIPGTSQFDFDVGVISSGLPDADVFWEQFNSTDRVLAPEGEAKIIYLSIVNFADITLEQLRTFPYASVPINGRDTANLLIPGAVFAVHTGEGNFAKALVTGPFVDSANHGLPIQWETLSPHEPPVEDPAAPEPSSFLLVVSALGAFALAQRRFIRTTHIERR